MSFIFIFRISSCSFPYLLHSFYNDVKICVTSYFRYEVSHEGKSCTKFLNQHNCICRKFNKLDKYSINTTHNKITGLLNNFNNLNVNNIHKQTLVFARDFESFQYPKFKTLWLSYCDVQVCYGTAVEHMNLLDWSEVCGGIICLNIKTAFNLLKYIYYSVLCVRWRISNGVPYSFLSG